jgi:hypothetical protein
MLGLLTLLTILDVAALLGILALFLILIANRLNNINANLADCSSTVAAIVGHVEPIIPGLGQINRTLGVIAGALPLLYGLTDKITASTGKRAN